MKRLGFYPGEWTYTETYPNGAVNHGTYTSKLGPGGNSLLNTFHSQGPVGDFEGMLIYTWDLAEGKYKAYVFGGDFPGALVETGEFEGEKLVFHGELGGGGAKVQLRNVTWMASPGKLVSETYMSRAGAPEKMMVRVEASKQYGSKIKISPEARTLKTRASMEPASRRGRPTLCFPICFRQRYEVAGRDGWGTVWRESASFIHVLSVHLESKLKEK